MTTTRTTITTTFTTATTFATTRTTTSCNKPSSKSWGQGEAENLLRSTHLDSSTRRPGIFHQRRLPPAAPAACGTCHQWQFHRASSGSWLSSYLRRMPTAAIPPSIAHPIFQQQWQQWYQQCQRRLNLAKIVNGFGVTAIISMDKLCLLW